MSDVIIHNRTITRDNEKISSEQSSISIQISSNTSSNPLILDGASAKYYTVPSVISTGVVSVTSGSSPEGIVDGKSSTSPKSTGLATGSIIAIVVVIAVGVLVILLIRRSKNQERKSEGNINRSATVLYPISEVLLH